MKCEWKTEPLRNMISFISKGIAPVYADSESDTTIRVLNQKCNRKFLISYAESRLHNVAAKKVPDERYIIKDDILVNSTGTGTAGRIAQVKYVPCPTTVDGHMIIIRANEKVTQKYLGFALKAHQWEILKLDEGSTGQTELNRERLLDEIMVSYPISHYEQNRIVNILSTIDDKIELNQKINDNLARQAQAIFKAWFVDFEPFGGVIPDDWKIGTLSEICDYSKGKVNIDDLTLDTYYSTENMQPNRQGAVQATTLPTIKQTTACKKGDVLVSNIRPYFKKILYCFSDCGCSTDVLCFVPNKIDYSAFLYCALYADKFFDYMVAGAKGTKMPRGDKQQIMA